MTSSNGNIFDVTGHLCGEFTGPGEFPAQRPVTRSFDVFFDLRPNKRLSKHWWCWWFETQSRPLWRHCNDDTILYVLFCIVNFEHCKLHFMYITLHMRVFFYWYLSISSKSKCLIQVLPLCFSDIPYFAGSVYGTAMHVTQGINMMTSSKGNIFRVTGHLCGEFTGDRWIPRTKASDAELWCFLWSASE